MGWDELQSEEPLTDEEITNFKYLNGGATLLQQKHQVADRANNNNGNGAQVNSDSNLSNQMFKSSLSRQSTVSPATLPRGSYASLQHLLSELLNKKLFSDSNRRSIVTATTPRRIRSQKDSPRHDGGFCKL